MRRGFGATIALLISSSQAGAYDVAEKSIAQLRADMAAGRTTSAEIVSAYLGRIDAIDRRGPAWRVDVVKGDNDSSNRKRGIRAAALKVVSAV